MTLAAHATASLHPRAEGARDGERRVTWLRGPALALLATALACGTAEPPTQRPEHPPDVAAPTSAAATWVTTSLPSGLRLVTDPDADHDDGFAALLWLPSGLEDEPAAFPGLRGLMARAATLGTHGDPDRATGPYRRALLVGGALSLVESGDGVGWLATGPRAAGPSLLQILFDVAGRPSFSATRVLAMAELQRERLALARDPHVARAAAWATGLALGRGAPTAHWATMDTLSGLNREDVVRLHARVVRPERAALVAVGAEPEHLRRAATGWRSEPAPPPPGPACPAAPAHQAYVAAPPSERAVVVALEVPPSGHAERQVLDALLAEQATALDVGDVDAVVIDLGRRATLLVSSRGPTARAAERVDSWLRRLAGADLAARADTGRALLRAGARPHAGTPPDMLAAARGAFSAAPDGEPAPREAHATLAAALRDTDARVRVAVGPEDALDALRAWGPAVDLTGAVAHCAGPGQAEASPASSR